MTKILRRITVLLLLLGTMMYLSGCGTLTYNPSSKTEKVKMTFGG